MPQQIQSRRGTASQWTTANTLLAAGEIGAETHTGRFKIGNGSTTWNSLPYAIGMTWKGTWSSATAYNVNDVVYLSGSSYIAILAGTNQNPSTATTYWSLMSQAGTNGTIGGSTGATDNALLRADGTAGGTLQNSVTTLSDTGVMAGAAIQNTVYAITDGASVDLAFANGEIQTWTLGANRTPTATTLASGQGITLVITAGAFSVTWTTIGVSWTKQGGGGTAPTLSSTLKSTVILWKVGSTVYGSYLGDA